MVSSLLRRLGFGVLALYLGLTGSYFFFSAKYTKLSGGLLLHSYWVWLRGLFTGRSYEQGLYSSHVFADAGAAFGRTLLLIALTFVLVLALSLPLGCLSALKRGSLLDLILRSGSYAAWAVPAFLSATIFQEAFGRIPGGWGLGWFPYVGWAGECPNGLGIDEHTFQCPSGGTGLNHIGLVFDHILIPAIALALGFVGLQARYLRNSLVDVLDAPYITVARAKGLTERALVLRHGVRNALVTFVPALVSDFGAIFGAALAVDFIFQLGGIGTLFINALKLNVDSFVPVDTYAIQIALLLGGALMLTLAMLGEVVLWGLDPRVRHD